MHIVPAEAGQMAVLRRNPLGRRWLRRGFALLRPRRTAEGTPSASRLDPLASSVRRVRAPFSYRLLWVSFAVFLFPVCLAAQYVQVREDMVRVSPPRRDGKVTVSGAPGTVIFYGLTTFSLENRETEQLVAGKVEDDGSFTVWIPAAVDDRLKMIFNTTASDDKVKLKRKVPAGPQPSPAHTRAPIRGARSPRRRTSPAPHPRGDDVSRPGSSRSVSPVSTPEIIIRYKGDSGGAVPSDSVEGDMGLTGILPPD